MARARANTLCVATQSTEPPSPQAFLDALSAGALTIDGAMGTALYEKGNLYTQSFEAMNVEKPEVVRKVHESFLAAGARVLETNTFGANRVRLGAHALEGRVAELNRAGVELARGAAAGRAFVAGAVGPSGKLLEALQQPELDGLRAAFLEQCHALCDAGVDALFLETFRQADEIRLALSAAREVAGEGFPIVAMMSFDEQGAIADGRGPREVAEMLRDLGASGVGVNCATGPAGVYEMATQMLSAGLPVVAVPNAGMPQQVEGRLAYMATPEYFQVYARRLFKAGVHAVGGCCGTTPDHIRKIAAAARMMGGGASGEHGGGGMRDDLPPASAVAPGVHVVPTSDKGLIGAQLGKRFLISVEVNPTPGLSLEKSMAGARALKAGGVDIINVADGPRAQARMGNLALCLRIQQELDMPALMHVTSRDRNLLGQVAYLMAAHELGVHNLVVITGDPPKMGDFPDATAVYDTDSVGLLQLIRAMNHGLDAGGKPLGGVTRFLCATGAEPAAQDYARELRKVQAKRDAGAEFIMTQPVYDPAVLDRFLTDIEPFGLPVLVGLLPLASYRNAEFLHNEVPGMRIPDEIRERMRSAGTGEAGRAEGVAVAREMLSAVKDRVAGAYIMPPFGRHELALSVIDGIVR